MLIGIAGKIASGKTTTAEIIEKEFGEDKVFRTSLSSILIDALYNNIDYADVEIEWNNKELTRENLIEFGKKLKENYGDDVLVDLAVSKGKHYGKNVIIIDGVRTLSEAEAIKKMGGVLIYIDSLDIVRFEFMRKRNSEKDKNIKTFDDFLNATFKEDELYSVYKLQSVADYIIHNTEDYESLETAVKFLLRMMLDKR